MRCPCRKKSEAIDYASCCAPYHGGVAAPTAAALMRARYSAFVLGDAAYLTTTWHPSTRPPQVHLPTGRRWIGLSVHAAQVSGDQATVAFTARSRAGGTSHALKETSRFVREGGRWYYLDGDIG